MYQEHKLNKFKACITTRYIHVWQHQFTCLQHVSGESNERCPKGSSKANTVQAPTPLTTPSLAAMAQADGVARHHFSTVLLTLSEDSQDLLDSLWASEGCRALFKERGARANKDNKE